MSEPLNYLEITEMQDGEHPIIHEISISELIQSGDNGLVIGRYLKETKDGKKYKLANIEIGKNISHKTMLINTIGKRHITLYAIPNEVRGIPDLYLRRGYQSSNGWVSPKPDVGVDVEIAGVPIDRDKPIQLRPGALIELVPKLGVYQCKLQWAVESNGESNPTIPVDENRINQLQFENRNLKEYSHVQEIQINELKKLSNKIKTLADNTRKQNDQLKDEINQEREINKAINEKQNNKLKAQDSKIKRVRIVGITIVIIMALSLGLEIEQLEKIFDVATLLAGGGVWLAVSGKD